MADFELEQVDGEGSTFDLPHGETVIGRGPFLGVNDKRVSRNHGILENVNGQLRLKPTHVNPCFVQASAQASAQPLEKDQWHRLRDGSVFSLLPGTHLYRVRAVAQGRTPRNSQGFEEKQEEEEEMETEPNSKSSRPYEETLAYTPLAKNRPSYTYGARHQAAGDSQSLCQPDAPNPLTPRKTRVLPAWMMAAAPATLNTSPAKASKQAPARTPRTTAPTSKASVKPKRTRAEPTSSSTDEEEEKGFAEDADRDGEEGCSTAPRKRARRLKSETEESQDQATASTSSQRTRQQDEDVDAASKPDKREKKKDSKNGDDSQTSSAGGSTSVPENSGNTRKNVQKTKVQRRKPCPYGTSCYRKNPIHFQESSHPGDDDYEEEQNNADDEDDDRPECPYGTDCYRKNPQHKTEYKHTKPPAKKTARDDDDDEDQYENSFINDDSEEADEDSEYVPESEDSEKEDIKQLQKEAKGFLRRNK